MAALHRAWGVLPNVRIVLTPGRVAAWSGQHTLIEAALDVTAYEALGARPRQFVEFAFSPQSVAEAIRGVYTSLLSRYA